MTLGEVGPLAGCRYIKKVSIVMIIVVIVMVIVVIVMVVVHALS